MYVGQTINPHHRFKQHINDSNKENVSIYLHNAIRKHGSYNFEFRLIEENIPLDTVSEREKFWIHKLNTTRPNGYNLTSGGEGTLGYKHTEETKIKLSDMKKGVPTHKQTAETRAKISFANKGRKLTEEQLKRLKDSKVGITLTEEHKAKLSEALKGKPKSDEHKLNTKRYWDSLDSNDISSRIAPMIESRRKKVNMIDMNNTSVVRSFDSMRAAADWIRNNTTHHKASHTRISFVCGDTNKCAYGFRWNYK